MVTKQQNEKMLDIIEGDKMYIEILEKIKDKEHIDRIRGISEGSKEWKGTAVYGSRKFNFIFTDFWTADNGSKSALITSKKPPFMSDDEWDNLTEIMEEFIEEDYHKNLSDWEN